MRSQKPRPNAAWYEDVIAFQTLIVHMRRLLQNGGQQDSDFMRALYGLREHMTFMYMFRASLNNHPHAEKYVMNGEQSTRYRQLVNPLYSPVAPASDRVERQTGIMNGILVHHVMPHISIGDMKRRLDIVSRFQGLRIRQMPEKKVKVETLHAHERRMKLESKGVKTIPKTAKKPPPRKIPRAREVYGRGPKAHGQPVYNLDLKVVEIPQPPVVRTRVVCSYCNESWDLSQSDNVEKHHLKHVYSNHVETTEITDPLKDKVYWYYVRGQLEFQAVAELAYHYPLFTQSTWLGPGWYTVIRHEGNFWLTNYKRWYELRMEHMEETGTKLSKVVITR